MKKTNPQPPRKESDNIPPEDNLTTTLLILRTMTFDVVLTQWLNEAVKVRKAYTFIRNKGLYNEFLMFKQSSI